MRKKNFENLQGKNDFFEVFKNLTKCRPENNFVALLK